MTAQRWVTLAVVGIAYIVLLAWWSAWETAHRQREAAESLQGALRRIARTTTPREYGALLAKRIFAVTLGRDARAPGLARAVAARMAGYPPGLFEFYGFTATATRLVAWPPTGRRYEGNFAGDPGNRWVLGKGFRQPRWRSYDDWTDPTLSCHWRREDAAAAGPNRSRYALDPTVPDAWRVQHGHLVVNERCAPRHALVLRELAALRRRGWNVGALDRLQPHARWLPAGMGMTAVQGLVDRHFTRPGWAMRSGDDLVVLVPWQERLMLVGVVPRPRPCPGPWVALPVLVGLLLWRRWRGPPQPGVGLLPLLTVTVTIAAGIPLLITLGFWWYYRDSREAAVRHALFETLEQTLINIDAQMPEVVRERERRYLEVLARFTRDRSAVLRDLAAMELATVFDSCMIVSSAGRHLRDFSTMPPELRRLFGLAPGPRHRGIQALIDSGRVLWGQEMWFATDFDPRRDGIERMWRFHYNPERKDQAMEVSAMFGRQLVRRHNAQRGVTSDENSGDDSKHELAMSSLFESQSGDFVQVLMSFTHQVSPLDSGTRYSCHFAGFVPYPAGAQPTDYAVMVFHDLVTLELTLFDRLFARRHQWPAGMRFFSVSRRSIAFPKPSVANRFGDLLARLPPGHRLYRAVVPFAGRPHLLAALACRHARNNVLAVLLPEDRVGAAVADLQRQVGALGLAMAAILAVLLWRLLHGVVQPTWALVAGIEAMKQKRFNHRIPCSTGDEWDELATAFNATLAGMAELELAAVVQARLLPAGAIVGAGWRYQGCNTMYDAVGGDLYDARVVGGDRLAFMLGDVSGHGVSAALVVAMVKAGFEAAVRAGITTPGALLDRLSRLLIMHVKKVKMMTAVAGVMAPDGTLLLANAGHPWPVVTHADGRCELVRETSFPLGTILRKKYKDHTLCLARGSRLVLYSDGVSEGLDPDGNYFTIERVETAVGMLRARDPDGMIAELLQNLARFTREEPWHDDVSFGVLALD